MVKHDLKTILISGGTGPGQQNSKVRSGLLNLIDGLRFFLF